MLLARQICAAPAALISFVAEDHQWFKARAGFAPGQTPLSQSVCAHALHQADLLVIPDLTADPRTRDNGLVTGRPHLRFYAGAPLRTPEGLTLGTLCVLDTSAPKRAAPGAGRGPPCACRPGDGATRTAPRASCGQGRDRTPSRRVIWVTNGHSKVALNVGF